MTPRPHAGGGAWACFVDDDVLAALERVCCRGKAPGGWRRFEECFDAGFNVVADGADVVDAAACGVGEGPVLGAFAGEDRASVAQPNVMTASECLDGVGGEDRRQVAGDVNAVFGHGLDRDGVHLVPGLAAGGKDHDGVAAEGLGVGVGVGVGLWQITTTSAAGDNAGTFSHVVVTRLSPFGGRRVLWRSRSCIET